MLKVRTTFARCGIALAGLLAATTVLAQYRPAAVVQQLSQADDPAELLAGALRTLAIEPNNVTALMAAGRNALILGDPNAAVGFFGRASELAPSDGRPKAGLGSALVQLEKPQDALRLFGEASTLGMPDLQIAEDRGLAYDLTGDTKRAQADYAAVLAARPDDDIARRRLALSQGIAGDKAAALATLDPLIRKRDIAGWRAQTFVLAMNGDATGAAYITHIMMPQQADMLQPFLVRLASLSPTDKARAVHFGEMPQSGKPYTPTQLASTGAPATYAARPVPAPAMPRKVERQQGLQVATTQQTVANPAAVTASAVAKPAASPPTVAPTPTPTPTPVRVATPAPAPPVTTPPVTTPVATAASALRPALVGPPAPEPARSAVVAPPAAPPSLAATPPPQLALATTPAPLAATAFATSEPQAPGSIPSAAPSVTMLPPTASAAGVTSSAPVTIESGSPATSPLPSASPAPDVGHFDLPHEAAVPTPAPRASVAAAPPRPEPEAKPAATIRKPAAEPADETAAVRAKTPIRGRKEASARGDGAAGSTAKGKSDDDKDESAPTGKRRHGRKSDAAAPDDSANLKAKADRSDRRSGTSGDEPERGGKARRSAKSDDRDAGRKGRDTSDEDKGSRTSERVYVQVAGGANRDDMDKAWSNVKKKAPDLMKGHTPSTTPLKATNRLLVGPFKSDEEAQAFVNKMAAKGLSGFTFKGAKSQKIEKVGASK